MVHALHATKDGSKRLVVLPTDTDVFILLVHYWRELNSQGLEELWIKTGTGDSSRCSNPYPCSSAGIGALLDVASSAFVDRL